MTRSCALIRSLPAKGVFAFTGKMSVDLPKKIFPRISHELALSGQIRLPAIFILFARSFPITMRA